MAFDRTQPYGIISDSSPLLYVQGGVIYKSTDLSVVGDPSPYIFTVKSAAPSIVGSGMITRPLVAYIAHSFMADRTAAKWVISSITVSGSTITVNIKTDLGGLVFAVNDLLRIDGFAPFDSVNGGYFLVASTTGSIGVGNTTTLTGTLASGLANGTYTPPQTGVAWIYSMNGGGTFGGYGPQWLPIARAIMGNAFACPLSYMFGIGGGRFTGSVASDIGFLGWINALLSYLALKSKPKPQYCVVELGINDVLNSISLASMKSVALTGYQQLVAAGIKPIVSPIMGGSSGVSLAQAEQCQAFNAWNKAQAQTGLVLTFDPMKRLVDATSSSGVVLTREMDAGGGVHLVSNGAIDVAREFSAAFSSILPPLKSSPISVADQFDPTNNPTGSLCVIPWTGGTLWGFPTGTAGSVTLTGSAQSVGQFQALFNGTSSTTNPTVQQAARTDTNPDGSVVNGFEFVVTFPAATYTGASVELWITDNSGGFVHSTSSSGPYTPGDNIQIEAEISIDSTNLSGTPGIPSLTIVETNGLGANSNNVTFGATPTPQNSLLDSSRPGLVSGSWQVTSPVFTTTPSSSFFRPKIILPMGGTTTGAIVYRVRGASVRKVDPLLGEPF